MRDSVAKSKRRRTAIQNTKPADAGTSAKRTREYLPADERRRRILVAAKKVFAQTGLQGARTRDLARAARINQATLFGHFSSKEHLFAEAVVNPLVTLMAGIRARAIAYGEAHSREELIALGEASFKLHLEVMCEIYPLLMAVFSSDPKTSGKLYREQIVPLLKERGRSIRPLMKDELDPELIGLATFGVIFAVAMDRSFRGDLTNAPDLARQLTIFATLGFLR